MHKWNHVVSCSAWALLCTGLAIGCDAPSTANRPLEDSGTSPDIDLSQPCGHDFDNSCIAAIAELRFVDGPDGMRRALQTLDDFCSKKSVLAACEEAAKLRLSSREDAERNAGILELDQNCSRGRAEACFTLAVFFNRRPQKRAPDRAIMYYGRACDLGMDDACGQLAAQMVDSAPHSQDATSGLESLEKLCERGDNIACDNLRFFRNRDRGLPTEVEDFRR
jgi:TPR repeat protein